MMLVKKEHGELPTKTKVFSMGSFNKHRLKIKNIPKKHRRKIREYEKTLVGVLQNRNQKTDSQNVL